MALNVVLPARQPKSAEPWPRSADQLYPEHGADHVSRRMPQGQGCDPLQIGRRGGSPWLLTRSHSPVASHFQRLQRQADVGHGGPGVVETVLFLKSIAIPAVASRHEEVQSPAPAE